ncbi:hypothetical protein VTH82DRAFT_6573 [Thermothelomyces myriococcoides]
MEHASTYKAWYEAATELDQIEGNDKWKLDDSTGEPDYHPDLIRSSLNALDTARTNCDISAMLYLLRTSLSRDIGGMGHVELYRHSYVGTKALIEQYVNSALQTIESLVEKSVSQTELDPKDLLEGMVYARQNFGRSALLLSGGATFGMAHIGVLKTLYEQRLLPRIISGASAGSIVCAVLCTRKDEEIPDLIEKFPYGDLRVFGTEDDNLATHIHSLLTKGWWSDISNLTRVMRSWLGDVTFLEAYNRTRRICNICVSSASIYDVPRLLNYITAPNVLIWSAVAASCSVPLIFKGQPLLMKHPVTGAHQLWTPTPQQFIDGSVDNDLPMTRLAEMFNVNHFIVSQVNPHVMPFLPKDEQVVPGKLTHERPARSLASELLVKFGSITKEEMLYRMQFCAEMGIFPHLLTKLLAVMNQKYSGDINILPDIPRNDLPLVLKNPTPEFMLRSCTVGERATWPKLSRIRDRLAIELALDQAVHALRARVVFSRSQVNLRRAMGVLRPMAYRPPGGSRGRPASSSEQTSLSGAIYVVQPPSSGEITPSEDKTFAGRRGSGASIQLVVATKHRKPLFQDDDQSDEDEQLELKFRPSRSRGGPARGSGSGNGSGYFAMTGGNVPDGEGGAANGSGKSGDAKPLRLKRNAKSHTHIRAGKPAPDFYPRDRTRPFVGSETAWTPEPMPSDSGSEGAKAEDDPDDSSTAAEDEMGSASSPIGIHISPPWDDYGTDQAFEGLQSDADPYAYYHSRAESRERGSSSKSPYSES